MFEAFGNYSSPWAPSFGWELDTGSPPSFLIVPALENTHTSFFVWRFSEVGTKTCVPTEPNVPPCAKSGQLGFQPVEWGWGFSQAWGSVAGLLWRAEGQLRRISQSSEQKGKKLTRCPPENMVSQPVGWTQLWNTATHSKENLSNSAKNGFEYFFWYFLNKKNVMSKAHTGGAQLNALRPPRLWELRVCPRLSWKESISCETRCRRLCHNAPPSHLPT